MSSGKESKRPSRRGAAASAEVVAGSGAGAVEGAVEDDAVVRRLERRSKRRRRRLRERHRRRGSVLGSRRDGVSARQLRRREGFVGPRVIERVVVGGGDIVGTHRRHPSSAASASGTGGVSARMGAGDERDLDRVARATFFVGTRSDRRRRGGEFGVGGGRDDVVAAGAVRLRRGSEGLGSTRATMRGVASSTAAMEGGRVGFGFVFVVVVVVVVAWRSRGTATGAGVSAPSGGAATRAMSASHSARSATSLAATPASSAVRQPRRARRAFGVEPRQRRLDDALVAQGDERVRDAPGAPRGGDDARGVVIVGRERDARGPRGRGPDPLGHAARGVAVARAVGTPRVQTGLTRWAPNRTERIFSEDQTSRRIISRSGPHSHRARA